ncbi:MAG TPA: maleylpyruvate isomerase family mycothiol-dependent enzyme [Acidimicrobiales bacterium]|nr:maleylpyruvate isomerase family mycothiol-dependent enzyme [Acidimicrobiales bacterium]
MDPVSALRDQQAETAMVLDGVTMAEADRPTRCIGWSVADVLLHLAQSDEMAIASLTVGFGTAPVDSTGGWGGGTSVDDSVAVMVDRERGALFEDVVNRWSLAAAGLVATLEGMDLSTRVPWVAGNLSARTLATTRMSETWIHTQDIADAIGVDLVPSERLKLVARLAWRTLPYAFHSSGLTLSGPVAFRLIGPCGQLWEFVPDEPEVTTISGSAVDLCALAARRINPAATTLAGEGPDVANVLALVRTYA